MTQSCTIPPIDWDSWHEALRRFGACTSLTVSLYDGDGVRRAGPFVASRLANYLAETTLWTESGPGVEFERGIVKETVARSLPVTSSFMDELTVCGLPLVVFGEVRGVVVYGWVQRRFASGLWSERLARAIGGNGQALWRIARLESPVAEQRMCVYASLLSTIVESGASLRETVQGLEKAGRAREVLLAQVSHELRTPLGALSLRLQALLDSDLNDPIEIRASLEAMRSSTLEEARLIEDLIEAATTQTGRLSLSPVSAALMDIVQAAVSAVRPAAEQKRVSLVLHPLTDGDSGLLHADPQRLKQALWNVLANAVKFTPSGGSIELRLGAAEHELLVEVLDSGPGIEPEILPQVFEPFSRRTSDNAKGLGLGLTIAKQVVEMHRGTIFVENRGSGEGARFMIKLPRSTMGHEPALPQPWV